MSSANALRIVERADRAMREMEDAAIARLNASIDRAYNRLEKRLLQQYERLQDSDVPLTARAQTAALLEELGALTNVINTGKTTQDLFTELIDQANQNGAELAAELIAAIAPGTQIRSFAGVPIEAAAAQARDGVRRLSKWSEDYRGKISSIVEQGLLQNWGSRRTSGLLRKELGITKTRAETIARTETIAAQTSATAQRYKDNGLEYYQFLATADDRICPLCAARNMQVYKIGESQPPIHPRCRCGITPFKKEWAELGLVDTAWGEAFRDTALAEMRSATNREPDNGPSPFERAVGQPAPKPFLRVPDISAIPVRSQPSPEEMRSRQLVALRAAESEIVGLPIEHSVVIDVNGNEVFRNSGTVDEIRYTAEQVALKRGNILTHNHPLDDQRAIWGSSFSLQDIQAMYFSGNIETRVVSGSYEYSIRTPDGAIPIRDRWDGDRAMAIQERAIARAREEVYALGIADTVQLVSELNWRAYHYISEDIANEFGLVYSRQLREGATPKPDITPVVDAPESLQIRTYTANPRIAESTIDDALNAITTRGASDRIQRFRQFVDQENIAAVFYDNDQPDSQVRDLARRLNNDGFRGRSGDEIFDVLLSPNSNQAGFTHPDFPYVVIRSNGSSGEPFSVDAETLNKVVSRALGRYNNDDKPNPSTVSSIGKTASDTGAFLTYIHEVGHQVHYAIGEPSIPENLPRISRYSEVNDQEWFAEHFALWMIDANKLRRFNPEIADFIEDSVNRAIASNSQSEQG